MTTFVNTLFVQAMVNALVDSFDADSSPGYVEIRNGAQPAAGPDAVRTGVLLATIPLAKPAFGSATDTDPGASAALSGVTDDPLAVATGQATWYRAYDGAGKPIIDGGIVEGASAGDMSLNTVFIDAGVGTKIAQWSIMGREAA